MPKPLLSLDSLGFLNGTWSATSRDGKVALGSYTWARELGGHILARHGSADANCTAATNPVCGHNDLLYVFQDSTGAPLKAIYFDNEGHVIRCDITIGHEEAVSTRSIRDFAIFDSDPAALGPRFRLRYEHDQDQSTGSESMSGAFEVLQPTGKYQPYQQWYGAKQK